MAWLKKSVNGKVIDVDIELFELAAEGMALNEVASSVVFEPLTVEREDINSYINAYKAVYKSMAFPLYAIESRLKYAAIATFIKSAHENHGKMWIEDGEGLFILLDEENLSALRIVGNTWGVVRVSSVKEDNTSMLLYRYEPGYAEFSWVISRIQGKIKGGNYYSEFMGEFVSACNQDPMIMKWELSNILNFSTYRSDMELRENVILSLEDKKEIMLDVFSTGVRKTEEVEEIINVTTGEYYTKNKAVKVYGYDVYEKDMATGEEGKIQRSKVVGMRNLFLTLRGIKVADGRVKMPTYKGILVNGYIVYEIEKRIFVTRAYRQSDYEEIAADVELIGFDRGMVYLSRKQNIGRGIVKESIYSYMLADGSNRLCKVQFN